MILTVTATRANSVDRIAFQTRLRKPHLEIRWLAEYYRQSVSLRTDAVKRVYCTNEEADASKPPDMHHYILTRRDGPSSRTSDIAEVLSQHHHVSAWRNLEPWAPRSQESSEWPE